LDNQEGATPSTPDWDKAFGVTTPRVDTRIPKQAEGFASSWDTTGLPYTVEVEDRGQRTESGDETIWRAYEEGY